MYERFRNVGWMSVKVVVLLLGLAFGAGAVLAQNPGPPPGSKASWHCTPNRSFELPIDIAPKDRAAIREVILYVKVPGGQWLKMDSAPPTQKNFKFWASKEGEYWFTVVTVDVQGRSNPADVAHEPPMLIVVVDCTPPAVEMTPIVLGTGQPGMRCVIKDANPDYDKLQVVFQTDAKTWQPLEPVLGQTGVFCLPPAAMSGGVFRYMVEDKAKNKNSQDITIQASAMPLQAKKQVTTGPEIIPVSTGHGQDQIPSPPKDGNTKPVNGIDIPSPPKDGNTKPVNGIDIPCLAKDGSTKPVNRVDSPGPCQHVQDLPGPISLENTSSLPPASKPAAVHGSQSRQVLKTPVAMIDYRLDKVGPSGVGKVEVWAKDENATAWQRLTVDASHKNPIEVHLPHDGLFGIRLVVGNGNGTGGNPPQPQDQPSFWIEVDSTPPCAQLQPFGPIANGTTTIDIHWTASDKNLGGEPINLYYSTKQFGPWQPIARNLPNNGQYHWTFPRDLGTQCYVRLEVTDEAGNITTSESACPLALDQGEPQAAIVGVRAAGQN
jgi:hypothetical protein